MWVCVGRSGDTYFAIDDTCPHAGGSLGEGIIDRGLVICPLHAYGFEIATGRCVDDHACSVSTHPVRISHGIVQVRIQESARQSRVRPSSSRG